MRKPGRCVPVTETICVGTCQNDASAIDPHFVGRPSSVTVGATVSHDTSRMMACMCAADLGWSKGHACFESMQMLHLKGSSLWLKVSVCSLVLPAQNTVQQAYL